MTEAEIDAICEAIEEIGRLANVSEGDLREVVTTLRIRLEEASDGD